MSLMTTQWTDSDARIRATSTSGVSAVQLMTPACIASRTGMRSRRAVTGTSVGMTTTVRRRAAGHIGEIPPRSRETTDPRRWAVRLSPCTAGPTIRGTIMTTLRLPSPPRPDLHLDRPGDVEVRETHISWVFLAGDRAYKVKKPIRLPYLDYRTPARRLAMCRAEVELNRRLAPDDLPRRPGTGPATRGRAALAAADDREAVDFAVEMRRFDEADTLDSRLRAGAAGAGELARLGRRLADSTPARAPSRRTTAPSASSVPWTTPSPRCTVSSAPPGRRLIAARERMAGGILAAAWDELDRRGAGGRIREGHGDLRLEHVILGDLGPAVVDCVEFDPGLRSIDVAGDLAFLVMDLHRIGRGELAPVLVAAYREAGGDPGSDALLALLAAYRAYVRAKVALTRTAQHGPAGREDAEQLLGLAARHALACAHAADARRRRRGRKREVHAGRGARRRIRFRPRQHGCAPQAARGSRAHDPRAALAL